MTIDEYRLNLIEEIKLSAEYFNSYAEKEFVKVMIEKLSDYEEMIDPVECYYEGFGRNRKKIQFDGYLFDEADDSLIMIMCDYVGEIQTSNITASLIDTYVGRMASFVEEVISSDLLDNIDISEPAYGFGMDLKRKYDNDEINKIKFYIITDKYLSNQVKTLKAEKILGIDTEHHVWDIERFYRMDSLNKGKEEIRIDFKAINNGKGLMGILATDDKHLDYKAYLSIVPGILLANLYLEYGSKLLEGNVRSFLSIKSGVNKGIQKTILNEPEKFFTYNNGIAVTATKADIERTNDGLLINSIEDMQIINGAQTTASLAIAKHKYGRKLDDIYVPMKLTVVEKDKAEQLIPFISKYSNSQNKVSEADFFSNHPFHIRMEQISRKMPAPAIAGNQYQTHWYYERTRGQYQQEQMKMTASQRAKFILKNPKSQVISKTDLAKFMNTYFKKPHVVSLGAQRNMRDFADSTSSKWDSDDSVFNDFYYRRVVSVAIMFKQAEKIVMSADWYEQGYRANIVTYSLSKLFDSLSTKYPNKSIDYKTIWQTQRVPDYLIDEIENIGKLALDHITNDRRPIQNVTEWCKKQECWNSFKNIDYQFSEIFINKLIDKNNEVKDELNSHKDQKLSNQVSLEIQVVNLGSSYWGKLLNKALAFNVLLPKEKDLLTLAAQMDKTGRTPSSAQARLIIEIKNRLEEEGIKVE